jgi:O-antigen/teichoic acid export membrane protein
LGWPRNEAADKLAYVASILSNASVATVGRVINAVIGLAVTALFTRWLLASGYGAYIALLAYGTIWQIAADFGLYLTLTRLLGKSRLEHQEDIAATVSLRLTLVLIVGLVALGAAQFFSPIPNPLVPLGIMLLGLGLQSLSQLCIGIYQAHSRMLAATVGDVVGRLVQLLIVGWVFITHTSPTITIAALIFTIGTGTAFVIHYLYLPNRRHFWPKLTWQRWHQLLKVSWPLGALLVLNTIYFRIDMIMLPIWRSTAEIGLYALAYRLIENILFFPAMFGGLLLPHVSAKNSTELRALLAETLQIVTIGALMMLMLLLLLPAPIISLIGGQDFLAAVPLLQTLSLALGFMFFGNIFGFVLVAQGRNKTLLSLYVCLVVFNVIANRFFIPQFGVAAAAWITVITEAAATCTAGFLVLREVHIQVPLGWLGRALVATAICAALVYILPSSVPSVVKLGAAALLFLALHIFFGTIQKKQFPHLLTSS